MRPRFPFLIAASLAALATLLVSASAYADTPMTVDLEPHWRVGEQVDYLLKKTGIGSVGGVVKVNTWNTTPVHLEVAEIRFDGFLISCTLGETRFDDAAAASMSASMKRFAGIMAGRRMMLRVDRHGRLVEIVNWHEVQAAADSLADELAGSLVRPGISSAQVAFATDQFKAKFSSEANVRALAMREAQLLFLTLGHHYEGGRPTEYATIVPNPAGEGLISVEEHVESSINAKTVTLEWSQRAARTTKGVVREEEPTVHGRATIDASTGWASSVVQTTSARASDAERTETVSLQRR